MNALGKNRVLALSLFQDWHSFEQITPADRTPIWQLANPSGVVSTLILNSRFQD